ncbi:MAG: hypothetical protein GY913_18245 [Proteobacteria bacterium]|nr:hypothetical protein [Pseudomonadota bacterium]MCP4918850.1 hypothetical protein [Pseudomonadota bacterium]
MASVLGGGRDALLRPAQISALGMVVDRVWDAVGNLESKTTSGALGSASWSGSRDDRGRLVSETVHQGGGPVWMNAYTYDEPGWLVQEARGRTSDVYDYVYDAAGNRQERWKNGVLDQTLTWSGSKLDAVGSTTIDYDGWEQVVEDQNAVEYERDARGQVSIVTDGTSNLVEIVRDGRGLAVESDDGGVSSRLTTWGLAEGRLPLEVRTSGGSDLTYITFAGLWVGVDDSAGGMTPLITDHNGNVIRLGMETLERDDGFGAGAAEATSVEERFLYAGLEAMPDVPGMMLAQQRLYDTETGRFLAPDPIGLDGGCTGRGTSQTCQRSGWTRRVARLSSTSRNRRAGLRGGIRPVRSTTTSRGTRSGGSRPSRSRTRCVGRLPTRNSSSHGRTPTPTLRNEAVVTVFRGSRSLDRVRLAQTSSRTNLARRRTLMPQPKTRAQPRQPRKRTPTAPRVLPSRTISSRSTATSKAPSKTRRRWSRIRP